MEQFCELATCESGLESIGTVTRYLSAKIAISYWYREHHLLIEPPQYFLIKSLTLKDGDRIIEETYLKKNCFALINNQDNLVVINLILNIYIKSLAQFDRNIRSFPFRLDRVSLTADCKPLCNVFMD